MEPNQINALLLLEDDQSSHTLFIKAFDDFFENSYDLKLFNGGKSLIDYLEEMVTDPMALEPSVILLKVNAASENRLQTLHDLKTNGRLKNYPVIVYSLSADQDLVNECYDMHANSFIHRDPDDSFFYQSIINLLNFWFTVVLPPVVQTNY